ncbi:MAG TPA: hypothetical protein VMH86_12495 [Rhizomicrobium sp.]|nr:hypothetical protein [Rhizomicrobium sp.]
MRASRSALAALVAAAALVSGAAMATDVTTYHYDNQRTGWDQSETALTPATVLHGSGGQTFKLTSMTTLDDQVDAQPLLMSGQHIQGHGTHDVVYVATENNTLYAIDSANGHILLQRHFGPPVPIDALPGGCNNNADNVGIGGTPVIDAQNGVMYVITYTYMNNIQNYYLHKIALDTLQDVVPKLRIQASGLLTNGHAYHFTPSVSRQRAGMLLNNGKVYAGFASFCDVSADQSRGWVLGWDAGTLAPLSSNELANKLPQAPDDFFLTSIWMSGYGVAANANGDVYFVTGNSDYSGTTIDAVNNVAESAVKLSGDLSSLEGVFTPGNAVDLEQGDVDYGSGGLMLLPAQPNQQFNLAVAAGKDGNMYLLNADSMAMVNSYGIGGCWCGQSYFTGADGRGRVVSSGGNNVGLWTVNIGSAPSLHNNYFTDGLVGDQDGGFFTAVSSNGTTAGTAVIWAVSRPDGGNGDAVSLYAFNANSGATIFQDVAGDWPNTGGNSNIVPVVANGKVFVAAFQSLAIYGLSSTPAAPRALPPLPVVRRVALAPGQHEVFGLVKAMAGYTATVQRRDGSLLAVDMLAAAQSKMFAEPRVGHGILVRGTYTSSGSMKADVVLHAKDHPKAWQPDR